MDEQKEDIFPEEIDHKDLQLFADKVGIIVALESNPHNSIEISDAYKEIKSLWKRLKKKKKKSLKKDIDKKSKDEPTV